MRFNNLNPKVNKTKIGTYKGFQFITDLFAFILIIFILSELLQHVQKKVTLGPFQRASITHVTQNLIGKELPSGYL